MIIFGIIFIVIFIISCAILLISHSVHKDMARTENIFIGVNGCYHYNKGTIHTINNASFKEFKKEFYKVRWKRDLNYKMSLFGYGYDEYHKNRIHASIVIINSTKYVFSLISYLRFSLFMFKNRTTSKNFNIIVNNICDVRKQKLKQLKNGFL